MSVYKALYGLRKPAEAIHHRSERQVRNFMKAHLAAIEGELAEGAGLVHAGGLLQRLEASLEHRCPILQQLSCLFPNDHPLDASKNIVSATEVGTTSHTSS